MAGIGLKDKGGVFNGRPSGAYCESALTLQQCIFNIYRQSDDTISVVSVPAVLVMPPGTLTAKGR